MRPFLAGACWHNYHIFLEFFFHCRYCRYQEAKSIDKELAGIRSVVLSLLILFNYGLLVVDRILQQRVVPVIVSMEMGVVG